MDFNYRVYDYHLPADPTYTMSFNEYINFYQIEEGSEEYIQKLPMTIRMEDGTPVGFIHEIDYYNAMIEFHVGEKKEFYRKERIEAIKLRHQIYASHKEGTVVPLKVTFKGVGFSKKYVVEEGGKKTIKESRGEIIMILPVRR